MPRDGDGGRRVGVARRLERCRAFGQRADEGADMRVAGAIGVDGVDLKAGNACDVPSRSMTKAPASPSRMTTPAACGQISASSRSASAAISPGRRSRLLPRCCSSARWCARARATGCESGISDDDWRRIEDEGKFCGDRLDPVGKRLAAAGVAQRVAGGENPVARLELERRKRSSFRIPSAPGHDTKVRSASPVTRTTQLPVSIEGDGGVSVSMPSAANAARKTSPFGPVPCWPANTTLHAGAKSGDHHVEAAAGDCA